MKVELQSYPNPVQCLPKRFGEFCLLSVIYTLTLFLLLPILSLDLDVFLVFTIISQIDTNFLYIKFCEENLLRIPVYFE